MKHDFKKLGILGIVLYILSLPILIWRGSKIGKVIYLAMILVLLARCVPFIINAYFNVSNMLLVRQEIKPVLAEIEELKIQLLETRTAIVETRQRTDDVINNKINTLTADTKVKLKTIGDEADTLEKALSVIRELERAAIKDRIIEIKEQVKLHNRSIDEAEIRKQLEVVADNTFLLTKDERSRFYKDLKDIGFEIEKISEKSVRISSGGWGMVSSDATYIRSFASVDSNVAWFEE